MKTIYSIFFFAIVFCFSACEENSPPYGPTSLACGLRLVDAQGQDLLAPNLRLSENKKYVLSPFTITATCNNKTIVEKEILEEDIRYYHDKDRILFYSTDLHHLSFSTDLHHFDYMHMEGSTGTLIFKLQLSTVFEDNRETVVEVRWKVKEKTVLSQIAQVEEIYLNGVKVDAPIATLVVDQHAQP